MAGNESKPHPWLARPPIEFNGVGMRYTQWLKRPHRWSTMTRVSVGVVLVLIVHGAIRTVEWLIR